MLFYMMNKDEYVAEFSCTSLGVVKQIYLTNIINDKLLPIGLKNGFTFTDWLNSRLVLSHRKNVIEMFGSIGIINPEDIIQITHGISLNDTFWIKRKNEKTKWSSVSPYRNPLNKEIADYSFDSSRKINVKHITHSPDFATSGDYPKCWKKINGIIYLIKGGTSGYASTGNEPFSEIHADILASHLGIRHIKYEYIKYRGLDATKCPNMCNESLGIYPLNVAYPKVKGYADFLKFSIQRGEEKQALDMLLLDYLILNTDRHFGNISYFVNNDTQEIIEIAPVYDNNLAFIPYYLPRVDGSIEDYISSRHDDIVTRSGISFEELFDIIDCRYVRNKIKLLAGYNIVSKYNRCDIANKVLKRQLSKIRRT